LTAAYADDVATASTVSSETASFMGRTLRPQSNASVQCSGGVH
jgi:hypothetical protein